MPSCGEHKSSVPFPSSQDNSGEIYSPECFLLMPVGQAQDHVLAHPPCQVSPESSHKDTESWSLRLCC